MITSGKLADVPDYTSITDQGLPPLKTPVNNNARLIRRAKKKKKKEDVTKQFGGFDPIGPAINKGTTLRNQTPRKVR